MSAQVRETGVLEHEFHAVFSVLLVVTPFQDARTAVDTHTRHAPQLVVGFNIAWQVPEFVSVVQFTSD